MMAKIDPGVVVGIDTKTQDEAAAERRAVMFEPFQMATLLPKQLVDHYKEKKGNEQACEDNLDPQLDQCNEEVIRVALLTFGLKR